MKLLSKFKCFGRQLSSLARLPLNYEYLLNPRNFSEIENSIRNRKSNANIGLVIQLAKQLRQETSLDTAERFLREIAKVPNRTHPETAKLGDQPQTVRTFGSTREFDFKPSTFERLAKKLNVCRTEDISLYTGPRSYFLLNELAHLEHCLIQYTIDRLKSKNFSLISVPDIIPRQVIESCGFDSRGERNQVYSVEDQKERDLCLSGTAEMGIAYYLQNKTFSSHELPLRLAAVSRCYRAETSKISEEKGIYRVHEFTKVEMFSVTTPDQSGQLLEEFRQLQEDHFADLGLQLRTLDMPECELGAQAHRKYDVEVYLPGKGIWGELSSASDCTDYQSRRLNITYSEGKGGPERRFAHTVNATACAVPRLILALIETHQQKDSSVHLPVSLEPWTDFTKITQKKKQSKMKNVLN